MPKNELERRYMPLPVEWRASGDGPGQLVGYAAKYNTLSQNLGWFVETIDPGCFDKSIGDSVRVLARYNHDDGHLLGTTDAGTLTLSLDDLGLLYTIDLPDTSSGRDVGILAARGDVRFSSFAFYCKEDAWGETDQGYPLRTLKQVQLVDVAPVNTPAYLDTTVAKRSLAGEIGPMVAEARAGKMLSASNMALLQSVLDSLGNADERFDPIVDAITSVDGALDDAQAALSQLLGVANPDADDPEDDAPAGDRSGRTEDTEQRDTHSEPRSIAALRLELGELQ
jgi:HK97 family phage prohead protease